MAISQDETLKGNEKIEEAILGITKRNFAGNAGACTYGYPPENERKRTGDRCCGDESRKYSDGSKKCPD